MNDREMIENCYRQMYLGMVKKDRGVLSEVLDDSFILVHTTGTRQTKENFIQAVEDGTLNYFSADHQKISTEIHGETAGLVRQSRVHAAVFGGEPHTWRLQLRSKLVRKGDTWKITDARASTY